MTGKLAVFSRKGAANDAFIGPPSPRSIKRRRRLIWIASLLGLIAVIAFSYYSAMRPTYLRVAVGPVTGDDAKVMLSLMQNFAREKRDVRLRPVLTDGVASSAQHFVDGNVDLAVVRGDQAVPREAQAVATLRKNVVVIWAPRARTNAKGKASSADEAADTAKLTRVPQIAGRRIGVIGRTDANSNLLTVVLRQYGIDPQHVAITSLLPTDVADAARDKRVDVFVTAGPINSKLVTDAIANSVSDAVDFIAIDYADAIAQTNPSYEAADIPAGAFGGSPERPQEAIKTISFGTHLVARKSLSEDTVAALTRQIFTARQTVMTDQPMAAKIEAPDTDKDAVIPVHPGAAAYIDGEEKSFLDRYSDYIWWALMGLSAVGSLGAWFASYLRKDERGNGVDMRDRLLAMLSQARTCTSKTELDRMQAEADTILRDMLTCFEAGGLSEASLTAFNIALEQFHNAVADRKSLLIELHANGMSQTPPLRATSTETVVPLTG